MSLEGKNEQYVGHFKEGNRHGFGRYFDSMGIEQDGLFENNKFMRKKSDIKSYNPNIHLIAM